MALLKYISRQFGKPTGVGGTLSTFVMNIMNQPQYKTLLRNININHNDVILDVGFGNGYLIKRILMQNPQLVAGVEISDDMIKNVSKNNKKAIVNNQLNLLKANVENMPFTNNYFDKIYTVNTIYFWQDINKGLSEIYRTLKSDGKFYNLIYTKEWLDKIPYTQQGFNKYTLDSLLQIMLNNKFKISNIIDIKAKASMCIIATK